MHTPASPTLYDLKRVRATPLQPSPDLLSSFFDLFEVETLSERAKPLAVVSRLVQYIQTSEVTPWSQWVSLVALSLHPATPTLYDLKRAWREG